MKTLLTTSLLLFISALSGVAQQATPSLGQPQLQMAPQGIGSPQMMNAQPSGEDIEKQKQALREQKKQALEKQFFPEILPQTEKIYPSFFEKNKYYILGGSILCLALLALLFRKKKQPHISPYEEAKLRFEIVKNQSSELDVKPYAEQVSQIVRDYIDKAHNIPAPERTTEEFLDIAAQSECFNDDAKNELSKILKLSDMAKFAKHSFKGDERDELLNVSIKFIEDDNASVLDARNKK